VKTKAIIVLDRPRVWSMDMNATIGLLEQLGEEGLSRLKILEPRAKPLTGKKLAEQMKVGMIWLWAGLRSDDEKLGTEEELTLARLGSLIDASELAGLLKQLDEASAAALPQPSAEENVEERPSTAQASAA
jgi:hypothetical protein